jgi:hypothetical protein
LGSDVAGTTWFALTDGQPARTATAGAAAEFVVTGLADGTGFASSADGTQVLVVMLRRHPQRRSASLVFSDCS